MKPFKIALGLLSSFQWRTDSEDSDAFSRALAYFPVVGMLLGVVLVLLDQGMAKTIPPIVANAVLLLVLESLRYSRKITAFFDWPYSKLQKIISSAVKFIILLAVPNPLRWIAFSFMTTFSSGILALLVKAVFPERFSFENVLWAVFICFFLAFMCGYFGFFVFCVTALFAAMALSLLKEKTWWIEDMVEAGTLLAVVMYHCYWNLFNL